MSELPLDSVPQLRPLLQRYPDARLATRPLIEPILFPYVALMFGVPVAALVSCYNAVALRRWKLCGVALLYAVLGWLAFVLVVGYVHTLGGPGPVALIAARLVCFIFGGLLYFGHRPYARGNLWLGGREFPVLQSYLAAFAVSMMVPMRVQLMLMGLPLGR